MKDFITKANDPAGDDSGAATAWGANESNSVTNEIKTPVTTSGQTPTSGLGADTDTNMLARAMTIYSQGAGVYTDSGSANSYILTNVGSYIQPGSYFDGMTVIFKPDNANTGNSAVNVSTIGSKKILLNDGSEVPSGGITTDRYYSLVYDSTLDTGVGAFVIKFDEQGEATTTTAGIVRTATDSEVNNQTVVDAYVKPGQLGSAAIQDIGTGSSNVPQNSDLGSSAYIDSGTGDTNIPDGADVTTRVNNANYITQKNLTIPSPGGEKSFQSPTSGYRFCHYEYVSGTISFEGVKDAFPYNDTSGDWVTLNGTTGSTFTLVWVRLGITG